MTSYDYWYNKWKAHHASNACIVRLTNRCNQQCRHCAFRSGPYQIGNMSVETCEKINEWIPSRVIPNIMGGEVTILANYPNLLIALSQGRKKIRIVTNGFWSRDSIEIRKFVKAMEQVGGVCKNIEVAVSDDHWHLCLGDRATKILEEQCPDITIVETYDLGVEKITPVGRAWDNQIVPQPENWASCQVMSNLLIIEDGMICRCPFGYLPWKHFTETTWHDAQEYVWGWRSEEIADGMSCHSCMEVVDRQLGVGLSEISRI